MDLIQSLQKRGLIKQCSDEKRSSELLEDKESPLVFYCGFDPTGSSLHCGHLVPLLLMSRLQKAGHFPIALIGGGTAMIGDPTGKTEMRKILDRKTIDSHGESFKKQMERIVDFSEGKALMLNNADWLCEWNYIDFLREVGRHFSVNRMLAFEAYKQRLETGLSFIEFNYQLLQSFDFYHLSKEHSCMMQIGGDDQWGNMVAGIDLTRRMTGKECVVMTVPLITRSDGKKMGKTESGALFLDPDLTPVNDFFQYWRNVDDRDVARYFRIYTFLDDGECDEMEKLSDQKINLAKERLAFEVTSLIHGESEAKRALESAHAAFGGGGDRSAIPGSDLERSKVSLGINVVDLFMEAGLCPSKKEVRRLITQGGAYVNGDRIADESRIINENDVDNDELLVKAGKKKIFRFSII